MPLHTTPKVKTVAVLVTDTDLVNNNPNRVQLTFVNNGAFEIHLDIDNEVSTTLGLRITASGTLTLNKLEDGALVTSRWVGIATGGTSNLRIFEVVKTGEAETE